MSAAVNQILDQIRQLPSEDRQLLDDRLAELEEEEWNLEAVKSRQSVPNQGIDQDTIDRAIQTMRYGS